MPSLSRLGCLVIIIVVVLVTLPVRVVAQSSSSPTVIFIPIVSSTYPPLASTWLERVNGYRVRAGVPPVNENSTLNGKCWEHARYMAENNDLTHNQDSSKPYASPSGQECAQKGNAWIGYGMNWQPANAIDSWMESVGHRLWLLYPTTTSFGFGFYTINSGLRSAAALDVLTNFSEGAGYAGWPVRYPGPGQTDVPAKQYPITLHWRYFGSIPTVTTTNLTVVGGAAIPHTVTTTIPGNHKGIVITPTTSLPANSLIEVSVSGSYDGQPFSFTWQFQTVN